MSCPAQYFCYQFQDSSEKSNTTLTMAHGSCACYRFYSLSEDKLGRTLGNSNSSLVKCELQRDDFSFSFSLVVLTIGLLITLCGVISAVSTLVRSKSERSEPRRKNIQFTNSTPLHSTPLHSTDNAQEEESFGLGSPRPSPHLHDAFGSVSSRELCHLLLEPPRPRHELDTSRRVPSDLLRFHHVIPDIVNNGGEQSERALRKTSILAMNLAKWLQT